MKRLCFLSLLLISPLLLAQTNQFEVPDLSGGMASDPSPNRIADNAANRIQNFFTDVEKMAIERNGYAKKDTTVLGNTKAVKGLWRFLDNTGREWIISFSSRTFYKNTIGVTPTTLGTPTTSDQVPDCASNLGKFWCVNGTDYLWWFDGTSTATVTSAPKGKLIENWRNRLAIGNITGSISTVRFSEASDGTSWTIATNPTSPYSIQIGGSNNGQNITCMYGVYRDNLIITNKYQVWAHSGFDQTDVVTRNINSQIGCIEDGSVQEFNNSLIFISNRGIEEMSGLSIENISEPIRDIVDEVIKNSANEKAIVQTTSAQWDAGTFVPDVYIDTETTSGSIAFDWPDYFTSFQNGDGSTKDKWVEFASGGTGGDASVTSGQLNLQNDGSGLGRINVRTTDQMANFQPGTTYHFTLVDMPEDTGGLSDFYFTLSPNATTSSNPDILSDNFVMVFESTTASSVFLQSVSTDSALCTSCSGDIALPIAVEVLLSTTVWQVKFNSVLIASGTHSMPKRTPYLYMSYQKGSSGSGTTLIDNFGVMPQTCTYTTQVLNPGINVVSWGVFNVSDSGATLSYEFGASTEPAIADFNSSSWTAIANGAVPTNSTAAYAGIRAKITASTWTAVPVIEDFTIHWNEGTNPAVVSEIEDRRYWVSITTSGASTPNNDTILVYQRNRTWTMIKGINAASFTNWRNRLYFGDSTGIGYVYRYGDGSSDDGSSITSRIITKSYDLGKFHNEKSFKNLFVNFNGKAASAGNFSVSYSLDQSSTLISLGDMLMSNISPTSIKKMPFPLSDIVEGREIQYSLTKSGKTERLKLYDMLTEFELKEAR